MRGLRFYAAMRRAEKRRAVNTEKRGLEAMMKEDFFLGVAQLLKTAMSAADTPEGDEKK